jgi:hypothetical protein
MTNYLAGNKHFHLLLVPVDQDLAEDFQQEHTLSYFERNRLSQAGTSQDHFRMEHLYQ